jgi:hypothetical protein
LRIENLKVESEKYNNLKINSLRTQILKNKPDSTRPKKKELSGFSLRLALF